MSSRATYPAMASVADTGFVIAGLTDEIREALEELDRLRSENEHLIVDAEFWANK